MGLRGAVRSTIEWFQDHWGTGVFLSSARRRVASHVCAACGAEYRDPHTTCPRCGGPVVERDGE